MWINEEVRVAIMNDLVRRALICVRLKHLYNSDESVSHPCLAGELGQGELASLLLHLTANGKGLTASLHTERS